MELGKYIDALVAEKNSLDPSYHVHAVRLLEEEIERVESGQKETSKDAMDNYNNNTPEGKAGIEPRERKQNYMRQYEREVEPCIKLSEKVMIPIKKYPKFNFVGRLLGPKGHTFKRLQNLTGCKMSILGRGSMRDREKEQELLESDDAKHGHLKEDLHVLIEVEAPKAEAHGRLAAGIAEVQKFLIPDPNDPIRQEQMRELAYLNGLDEGPTAVAAPVATVIASPVVRGRGRGRSVAVRGTHVVRSSVTHALPRSAVVATVSTPRHASTAPETYAYETHDAGYEYEQAYPEGELVYYTDYAAPETSYSSNSGTVRLKAPIRSMKSSARESTYPY
ncbi:KH domain-containing, RNA-binding, signal transduction-associated protein 2-like [Dendronephthya gigantea]|uniref:KH domain-containing, RNA-binding, signal transduction-associated protein 2-like n=1 Tax=Dendronephthya gigantea TaxID=151771 RepID=UPI00106D5AB5|nr:KH domain-containing, RNA-binding, signal transduction-associated protein 2-like [Dendronephthya gigantea]XP_028399410.1 KH domain-containing, RNA-binding, signal transduction-associated protein 2-like [Dendronephthya gigantea]XP_028399411.1 KH domain-containing, RNA-binding, signal transduction-associated protein 2-like [Dendronephthya gigantea]